MISGLFYYMVTIFNIIFPFHILLERFHIELSLLHFIGDYGFLMLSYCRG